MDALSTSNQHAIARPFAVKSAADQRATLFILLAFQAMKSMPSTMHDDKGPIIIDFKTAGRSGRPLEITHNIQLSVYSHLVRQQFGLEL